MRLRWTGFEPFGGFEVNPSSAFARAAAETFGARASFEELPVTYARAQTWGTEALCDAGPTMLWNCGLAGDRQGVWLERRAFNAHHAMPDNDGLTPSSEGLLLEGGPEVLDSALDLGDVASFCQARGLPVQVSVDAGRYVCNAILYHSLQGVARVREAGERAWAVFVHIGMMTPAEAETLGHSFGQALGEHLELTGVLPQ